LKLSLTSALILATTAFSAQATSPQVAKSRTRFVYATHFSFEHGFANGAESGAAVTRAINAGMQWNQAVISWNLRGPASRYGVQVGFRKKTSDWPWYPVTDWILPLGSSQTSHSSIISDARVDVDTVSLNEPSGTIQLAITADPYPKSDKQFKLDFIGVTLTDTRQPLPPYDPAPTTPIAPLDVPERCQMDYHDGDQHCSPTSLAMDLAYWAYQLHRPELNRDVNEIIKDVYDKEYKGSGNWSFNVAYAGQFPGIRAYVARLEQISELRAWLQKGVPVICSGSIFLLEGRERPAHDPGHLFVLVGFDANGDPIFNDPGRFRVRQTYKLADFEKAWDTSQRTVYLIYPETLKPPPDPLHHWAD